MGDKTCGVQRWLGAPSGAFTRKDALHNAARRIQVDGPRVKVLTIVSTSGNNLVMPRVPRDLPAALGPDPQPSACGCSLTREDFCQLAPYRATAHSCTDHQELTHVLERQQPNQNAVVDDRQR